MPLNDITKTIPERHKDYSRETVLPFISELKYNQVIKRMDVCGYTESKQPYDEIKHRHTLNESDNIAEGKYGNKRGTMSIKQNRLSIDTQLLSRFSCTQSRWL